MAKAYSYLRFSTPEQAKGDSFRRQRQLVEKYCAANGLTLDTELTLDDVGVSAFRGDNMRKGSLLAAFLRAVEDGLVEPGATLLVENLDRISREKPGVALGYLQQIAGAGVVVVTLSDGRVYTAENITGDIVSIIMSLLTFNRAYEESEMKSQRLSAAWEAKRARAAEGKPITAIMPAWLKLNRDTKQIEVIEERADVVRRIYRMVVDGIGHDSIAAKLNSDGVETFGKAAYWHSSYVRKILENDAVRGIFTPHIMTFEGGKKTRAPQEPIPGYFPAIIDEQLWADTQHVRSSRRRDAAQHSDSSRLRAVTVGKGGKVMSNMLSGLASCPACGRTMTRVSKGSRAKAGKPYLVCVIARIRTKPDAKKQCTSGHHVRQDTLESFVIRHAAQIIADAPARDDGAIEDALRVQEGNLLGLGDEIDRIVEAIQITGHSEALIRKLRELERLQREVSAEREKLVEQRLVTQGRIVAHKLNDMGKALAAEPFDIRAANAAMRAVLDKIVIDHFRGVLVFHWRHGGTSEAQYGMPGEGRKRKRA